MQLHKRIMELITLVANSITYIRRARERLGERLLADCVIDDSQLRHALEQQKQNAGFLGETLVGLGFVSSACLAPYLEGATGFPFVDLANTTIDMELARTIPELLARRKLLVAFESNAEGVHVALADPLDLGTTDDLRARLNRHIVFYMALTADLQDAINRVYDVRHKAQSVIDEIATAASAEAELSVDELVGLAEDAPIVRLVSNIVQGATANGCSDIHIEPQEHFIQVRFRQDGLLYEQMTFPRHHLAAVVSRIKVMSKINIAERRRPQDGKFVFKDENGSEYDMRVSIMPITYGEKVVMRVLPKSSSFANPDRLGFSPEQKEQFGKFIKRPHGIILVTGPTGSGKSTTLFAALNTIKSPTININTIEDPVEYNLPGVSQMHVNPKIGVTFAAGLRTLMRQDPDVIMVGEIRDLETAEVAIQAALTGHLVLSTLHTNDAPGALIRLQNMGVEPFLISSAMIGVIAQRLVRTVCPHCREEHAASPAMVAALGLPLTDGQMPMLAVGQGCTKCGGRGMKGRTAVYEIMPMTDALRDMVLQRRSGAELRGQAITEGMVTMRDSGVRKVMQGVTTADEIGRVLFTEDF